MDVFLGAIDVGTTGSILTCSHLAQTIHNRTSCFREIQIKGNRPESLALPLPEEYSRGTQSSERVRKMVRSIWSVLWTAESETRRLQ
jgi:hypothetical protein